MPIKTIIEANLTADDQERVDYYMLVDNEDGINVDEVPVYLEDKGAEGICAALKIVKEQLLLKVIKGLATDLECQKLIALNSCKDHD